MFYPANNQVAVTDGSAAPVTGDLRNYTPWHRSGGDVSVENMTFQRGGMGRAADEHGSLRRYAVSISDQELEQDDATNATNHLYDMSDARVANERIFQRTYETGHSRSVNALVTGVGDSYSDDDVLLMNVSLQATGTLVEVGF